MFSTEKLVHNLADDYCSEMHSVRIQTVKINKKPKKKTIEVVTTKIGSVLISDHPPHITTTINIKFFVFCFVLCSIVYIV